MSDANQAQQEGRVAIPLKGILGVSFVRQVLEEYFPAFFERDLSDLGNDYTMDSLIEEFGLSEEKQAQMMARMNEVRQQMDRAVNEEAKRLWPDADLSDPRLLWGTPEQNEACVSRLEEMYAGRTGEIVFYGPSNITLWFSLEKDMLPWTAQIRGMGGCTDLDLMKYADRLLYPFAPKVVFFQTGSNDLVFGLTPEQIVENKKKMYAEYRRQMPDTRLIVMSGLPLPGRMELWDATEQFNQLLEEMCAEEPMMTFMNATDVMMADEGEEQYRASNGRYFRPELFRMDRIHLNVDGHDVWTKRMKETLVELGIEP